MVTRGNISGSSKNGSNVRYFTENINRIFNIKIKRYISSIYVRKGKKKGPYKHYSINTGVLDAFKSMVNGVVVGLIDSS